MIEEEIDKFIDLTTMNNTALQQIDSSNDNNQVNAELNNDNIEAFNLALEQYLRLDEEIKTLLQAVRLRNEKKRNLSEILSNFLRSNNIKKINLDGSYKGQSIETNITTNITGFTKHNVTEALYNKFNEDEELFAKIMDAISSTSISKEVWKFKVISENKKKKKNINILDEAATLITQ